MEDALNDPRFATNPLVLGDPFIRFYAGAPLVTPDPFRVGVLCVIDTGPRRLTAEHRAALVALTHLVMTEVELRLSSRRLADALREVKALKAFLPTCSYCRDIRNEKGEWSPLEAHIMEETPSRFSHSICPKCMKVHFPELNPTAEPRPRGPRAANLARSHPAHGSPSAGDRRPRSSQGRD